MDIFNLKEIKVDQMVADHNDLVKKYIAGDESALAILINRHQSKIFGFINSKVSNRDLSDDIFQDTFIKVIKTLKSIIISFDIDSNLGNTTFDSSISSVITRKEISGFCSLIY